MSGYKFINQKPCIVYVTPESINKWSANYFSANRISMFNKVKESGLGYDTLSNLVKVKNERRILKNDSSELYIGLADVNSQTGEISYNNIASAGITGINMVVKKGQILFSKLRPNLNKVAICPQSIKEAFTSTEFCVLESQNVNEYYLFSVLKSTIGLLQVQDITSGSTLPRIDMEDILDIIIPVPSSEIQNYIGNNVRKAEQLREEAKKVYDLCEEKMREILDIKQNELLFNNCAGNKSLEYTDYSIKTFIKPNDINDRIDPKAYHPELYMSIKKMRQLGIKIEKLKTVLKDYSTGKSSSQYLDDGIPIIMTKNIRNNYIDWNCKRVSKETVNQSDLIIEEDVLITTYGGPSIGKVDIKFEDEICTFDYTIMKMRFKDFCNPYFMTLLLRSKYIQNQIRYIIKGTTGITFVIPNEILNIQLPIVDMETQNTIGELYKKYLHYLKKANELICEAKKQVEDLVDGTFDTSKVTINI